MFVTVFHYFLILNFHFISNLRAKLRIITNLVYFPLLIYLRIFYPTINYYNQICQMYHVHPSEKEEKKNENKREEDFLLITCPYLRKSAT